MKLYFDLEKERLLSVPRGGEINLIHLKAGGRVDLEVDFYTGKAATAPAFTPLIQFAVKTSEEGDILAFADFDAFTGSGAFWGGELLTNPPEMIAWLAGASSKLAVAELTIRDGEEGIPIRSQTLQVRVANHVIRGDEGTPLALPSPLDWLASNGMLHSPAITGLADEQPGDLHSLPTQEMATGQLRAVVVAGEIHLYRLVNSTFLENVPFQIRPLDYDASSNTKVWFLQNFRIANFRAVSGDFSEAIVSGTHNDTGGQIVLRDGNSGHSIAMQGLPLTGNVSVNLPSENGTLTTEDMAVLNRFKRGNRFASVMPVSTGSNGAGASGAAYLSLGATATVGTTNATYGNVLLGDRIWTHAGFSGAMVPSNKAIELYLTGMIFRIEPNENYKLRVVFGAGTPGRVSPLANEDALSARGWGVEFYWNAANSRVDARLFWYTSAINYGDPFVVPGLNLSSWLSAMYTLHMRQTANGTISVEISPSRGDLTGMPQAEVTGVVWGSTVHGGRHFAIEAVNSTAAATQLSVAIGYREALADYRD